MHRTCIFRTCAFHPCRFVLTFSVHAFSILAKCALSYLPFPYLRFPVLAFSAPPICLVTLNMQIIIKNLPKKSTPVHIQNVMKTAQISQFMLHLWRTNFFLKMGHISISRAKVSRGLPPILYIVKFRFPARSPDKANGDHLGGLAAWRSG